MTKVVELPDNYGCVILSVLFTGFLIPTVLGSSVMAARSAFDVPYPNLYATPGYHKNADAFNRVQRGHQSIFETLSIMIVSTMIGGLKYPIACSTFAATYSVGNILFLKGYSDTKLDVKVARYKKGGALKWAGLFGSMGCSVLVAGSIQKWW